MLNEEIDVNIQHSEFSIQHFQEFTGLPCSSVRQDEPDHPYRSSS